MKVKFTQELKHCRDGQIHPTTYPVGEYEVHDDVAEFALTHGFAVVDERHVSVAKPKAGKK